MVIDGAYSNKDDVGGWAAILLKGDRKLEIFGAEHATTNNRMELMAAIMGFRELKKSCEVEVICDSQYVIRGATVWHINWRRNNWVTAEGEPVKNRELWEEFLSLIEEHDIEWTHTRGHIGHEWNERADKLAVEARLLAAGHEGHGVAEDRPRKTRGRDDRR